MTQSDKTRAFASLHVKGDPLILFNVWDAGSAKAVAEAGARALATGSWSVAAAQGYGDGEAIPLNLLLTIASRIAATVDLPVSVDFEGGYDDDPDVVGQNVGSLIETGAIGMNFEDQRVGGTGLFEIAAQQARIQAAREASTAAGIDFFINARTDLFLKERAPEKQVALMAEAKDRAAAYKEAGASGFFAPGLVTSDLIAEICTAVDLPVNVMMLDGSPSLDALASLGVARISHGPRPYRAAMAWLGEAASAIYKR